MILFFVRKSLRKFDNQSPLTCVQIITWNGKLNWNSFSSCFAREFGFLSSTKVHYNWYNSYTIHTTKTHSANLYLLGFSPVIVVHCECSWSPWAATAIDRWQVQPFWSTQCSLHSYCTAGALWLHTRFGQRLMQCGRLTRKAYLWYMLGASFNGWGCCTGPRDKVFGGPIPPRLGLYVLCVHTYVWCVCFLTGWLVVGSFHVLGDHCSSS